MDYVWGDLHHGVYSCDDRAEWHEEGAEVRYKDFEISFEAILAVMVTSFFILAVVSTTLTNIFGACR